MRVSHSIFQNHERHNRADSETEEEEMNWKPIETAPKGGGAERTDDPKWVDPPRLLMAFENGSMDICHWDWYYAPGGNGYEPEVSAWIGAEGEQVARFQGDPIAWMPLPKHPSIQALRR